MKDRVLITGGFGYLGGRIAQHIARHSKYKVVLASRQARRAPAWLAEAATVSFDLLKNEDLSGVLKEVGSVVHLAALNEIESLQSPSLAAAINTTGTRRLLDAAVKAGVERFIYFSTAHVYGAPLTGHITEHSICKPVHPYAITHLAAEKFVLARHDKGDIHGLVLRLSNAFGAPADLDVNRWTLLVNDLCRQAVLHKELVLRSSGMQQRDFIAMHDVTCAVSHFLNLERDRCLDGLFNLGGECPMRVLAMAQRIAECCHETLGFEPKITRPTSPEGNEKTNLLYDIRKLKDTGFTLHGNVNEEIKETIKICMSK